MPIPYRCASRKDKLRHDITGLVNSEVTETR